MLGLSGCIFGSSSQDDGVLVQEQTIMREFVPTFLDLEYMYSFEVEYFVRASRIEGEFTWFDTFGSRGTSTSDEVNGFVQSDLRLELPEYIDLDENNFIAISMGRRLQKLYYFEEHYEPYDTPSGVFARPVFGREYYPNTVFTYRVTPLPKYWFMFQEGFTDDFTQFNTWGNVPFEVWPFDRNQRIGGFALPGGQITGSTLGEGWYEFAEPLYGYINIRETFFRVLPTEHSGVIAQLTHGLEFSIIGYVEGGMEIGGSGRWYYVRASTGMGGVRPGYIHSCVVTIVYSEPKSPRCRSNKSMLTVK